ncbi:band 7 protein [Ferroglobus placidus DSM 10642]|uniref:Band 7 protein n=1 Tax=Ferroglobus placidus (strain DSM 10642 / AEDII12DO) TaxID=589924 RepID=D3RYD1_FERPA|nr:prohibitin family protein [Ferroglobus placidus]ADC65494.1 band 7 protein [Ferroglobus placidus DSM 10642]
MYVPYPQTKKSGKGKIAALAALFGFFILLVLSSSVVVIDQTEVGVVKIFGRVQEKPLHPGLHFVTPFVTEVVRMPVYEKTMEMIGEKHIKALTSEGLPVFFDMAIQYKVVPEKAPEVYSTLKNYEIWMESRIRAHIRDIIAQYKAEDLYTENRELIQADIERRLDEEFRPYGILITAVLIRNIDLPESVERAIQAKIEAKQEAERMQFIVQKERLEAERKKVEAQGIAEANRIIGESLRNNPEYIQWYYLQVLDDFAKSGNSVILVPVPGNFYPGVNVTSTPPLILPTTK